LQAVHIGRWQSRVELLIHHIRAAEEFAAIGGGHDLELMGLGEIRTWRAIGIDDAFGQKVQHMLSLLFWHISSEKVIEAAILADDDDDMLDRSRSLDRIALVIPIVIISGSRRCAEAKKRYCEHKHTSCCFLSPFSLVTWIYFPPSLSRAWTGACGGATVHVGPAIRGRADA
jgi:hypothetical protein